MDLQLVDKRALVTGSSFGLGEAIAKMLAAVPKVSRPPVLYLASVDQKVMLPMSENTPNQDPILVAVNAFDRDITKLTEHGYHEVTEAPVEPGQFKVMGRDVAPGWVEYWYDLDVYELPDRPLRELGWGG
jgi:hypothetical protein